MVVALAACGGDGDDPIIREHDSGAWMTHYTRLDLCHEICLCRDDDTGLCRDYEDEDMCYGAIQCSQAAGEAALSCLRGLGGGLTRCERVTACVPSACL
jgi:hypothetical protein